VEIIPNVYQITTRGVNIILIVERGATAPLRHPDGLIFLKRKRTLRGGFAPSFTYTPSLINYREGGQGDGLLRILD